MNLVMMKIILMIMCMIVVIMIKETKISPKRAYFFAVGTKTD